MKRTYLSGKTGLLTAALLLLFGMTAYAAPSVEGDTEVTAVTDEIISTEYTITSDEDMESVKLSLTYDKDVLTYMSGSGGDNFAGSGGNGLVEMSSVPDGKTASFSVKFRGQADEDTEIEIASCTITVDGKEIDALTGEELTEEETDTPEEEDEEDEEDENRASFVIDGRTFYVRRPDGLDDYDIIHMDIQGIDCHVMKNQSMELYVIKLVSDNGSYRDNFVYNPDTGNVVPYIEMESGTDTVVFIEPDEDVSVPTRYSYVDMPWGAKYSVPAYKHVIIDGIDEIFDDTNRYLVYGINQDGEKAWYSYDYDKNSLQLFDETAYQGEQNYITELEVRVDALDQEASYQLERYNTNMGRRLTIILGFLILVIILANVVIFQWLHIRKLRRAEDDEEEQPEESRPSGGAYVTGSLEENETDFREPGSDEEDEEDVELEIIDLEEDEEEDE